MDEVVDDVESVGVEEEVGVGVLCVEFMVSVECIFVESDIEWCGGGFYDVGVGEVGFEYVSVGKWNNGSFD